MQQQQKLEQQQQQQQQMAALSHPGLQNTVRARQALDQMNNGGGGSHRRGHVQQDTPTAHEQVRRDQSQSQQPFVNQAPNYLQQRQRWEAQVLAKNQPVLHHQIASWNHFINTCPTDVQDSSRDFQAHAGAPVLPLNPTPTMLQVDPIVNPQIQSQSQEVPARFRHLSSSQPTRPHTHPRQQPPPQPLGHELPTHLPHFRHLHSGAQVSPMDTAPQPQPFGFGKSDTNGQSQRPDEIVSPPNVPQRHSPTQEQQSFFGYGGHSVAGYSYMDQNGLWVHLGPLSKPAEVGEVQEAALETKAPGEDQDPFLQIARRNQQTTPTPEQYPDVTRYGQVSPQEDQQLIIP